MPEKTIRRRLILIPQNLRRTQLLFISPILLALTLAAPAAAQTVAPGPPDADILHYIANGWNVLTRSMQSCDSFRKPGIDKEPVLYLPKNFAVPAAVKKSEQDCSVDVRHLPDVVHRLGQRDVTSLQPPGLLYLPHPYVVPGGMFNEMYGWDSYFIIRGLVEGGRVDLARGIVENFFFEIAHYGGVLNANRTYFLTRSQPPFLTSMIRAVYDAEKSRSKKNDVAWLKEAYPYAVKDYELWARAPHLAGDTGLARYFDFGEGPAPELGSSADDYYRGAVRFFLLHPETAEAYLAHEGDADLTGPLYTLRLCDPGKTDSSGCEAVEHVGLTEWFYKGDRSMRESGFDVSFRFGPYGAGTAGFAPVGLNSLLYKEETDLEWMSRKLGLASDAKKWSERARIRRERIDRYCWNASAGLYFDYNFKKKAQSTYQFATTFYPLWAGLATPEQARAVEANVKLFDRPGGIATSTRETGAQWDLPYGWAPLQLIAVEGLRRYHDDQDTNRISRQFLSMVLANFRRDGTIREKYNVVTRSSEIRIAVGYHRNVVGFGWTNGVYSALLHELPGGTLNSGTN